MEETKAQRPRLMIGSCLTAAGAFLALNWIGAYSSGMENVFSQVKVPIPALTLLFVAVPRLVWISGGILIGVSVCLKDYWMTQARATGLNVIILACLFLLAIGALYTLTFPLASLLEGISTPPR